MDEEFINVRLSKKTHSGLTEMCKKNETFSNKIQELIESYEKRCNKCQANV